MSFGTVGTRKPGSVRMIVTSWAIALAASASEAINSVAPGPSPVASLEYRDRALTMKLKPGTSVPLDQLRTALAARNLSLTEPNAGVLQIRSGK